jgi:type VI secretion system secreted protein Hcp
VEVEMATQAYVKIKGSKQGQFKGETTQKAPGANAIPVVRFTSTAQAPRDAATGQASGKRQWQPIRLTKEWGAASPQLLNALTTNEVLTNVVFEFWRVDQAGKEQLHYRITLTNATVASITSSFDRTGPTSAPFTGHELEDVELTFQSISVEDLADKTTAADNLHDLTPVGVVTPQPTPIGIREPVRPG